MCVLLLNIIRPYIGINISVNGKVTKLHGHLNVSVQLHILASLTLEKDSQ